MNIAISTFEMDTLKQAAHDELVRKMTDLGIQEPDMASPDRAIQTTSRAYEVLLMVNRCSKMELTDYILKLEESRDGYAEELCKNEQLKADNEKLRELVRDMFEEIEYSGFDPFVERQGKRGSYYEEDPSWRVGIRERIRELGIEVGE